MSISIDSRFDPEDYNVAVARGKYPNVRSVTAFGYSPSTASVTNVNVWEPATLWVPLTVNTAMEFVSSSASDAAVGTSADVTVIYD